MTIGRKILGVNLVLLVLLVIVAVIGIVGFRIFDSRYSYFLDVEAKLVNASNMLLYETANQPRYFRGYLLYPNMRNKYLNELQDTYKRFDGIIEDIKAIAPTQEAISMLNEIANLGFEYRKEMAESIDLVKRGKEAEAVAQSRGNVVERALEITAKVEQFRGREQMLKAEGRTALKATESLLSTMIIVVSMILKEYKYHNTIL